jgi:hypothetical protein
MIVWICLVVNKKGQQFDASSDPPGPYHIEPILKAFYFYGAVPVCILWLGFFAIRWVKRGFGGTDS